MRKFAIVFGHGIGEIQKRAIEELSRILLDYTLEYPICCEYRGDESWCDYKRIYVGTRENHPYIEMHSPAHLTNAEEYYIKVEKDFAIIEGYDDAGVLYGAIDFYNKYIVKYEHPDTDRYWVNFLEQDELPSFAYSASPSVKERGLWTWGHVIYDYRGYIDHMMRLKLNRLIIWNDFVPINARNIVEYAHARNVKVIWGFSWLWDTSCGSVDLKKLEGCPEEILSKYESEYAGIGADGIYFQTFTELHEDNIGGVLIAKAATDFVNRTAALFYEKYPDLELQFGLHATSVKDRLEFIKCVDPRIRIVWENCGSFPFSYIPGDVACFEETKRFVQSISQLRGAKDRFGAVTKGLVKLDWSSFEHQTGSQCIGESSEQMKRNRVERKRRIWRYIQAGWLTYADKAHQMVREMCRAKEGELSIYALVEDGMFEENVMYPVALYSEMLWNCENDVHDLMREVALRSDVIFA